MALSQFYLGIMSGTSVDAIDIALVEINDNQTQFIAGEEYSFDATLRDDILTLCEKPEIALQKLGEMTTQLTIAYADAINSFLTQYQLKPNNIAAIGCHGQTVFHQPNGRYPFSMQLVNPSVLAAKTQITTITDFRSMDIALGGQGAPLVPLFHQSLLHGMDTQQGVVFLNLGGIANISIVSPSHVKGYDTGPGNVLIDMWVHDCLEIPFDQDGCFARKGEINQELLNLFLSDAYFGSLPPKSTGREYFNRRWLDKKLAMYPHYLSDEDIMATLTALTNHSVANELKRLPESKLIICGGGSKNPNLVEGLQALLTNWDVVVAEETELSSDFMEAMAFAWLAYRSLTKQTGNAPDVTGASKAEICGQITQVLGHAS